MYEDPMHDSMEFSICERKYKIDFRKMCQRNSTTGLERQLRRRPEFVSQVEFEKRKSTYVFNKQCRAYIMVTT